MEVDGVNVETVVKPAVIMGQAGHGEGADAMEAGCDNGTGHVEAGHGEGADAMEADCDNGTGLAMVRGQMLWKPAVIMDRSCGSWLW